MVAIQWHSVFFLLFALAACGSALAVVLAANIVRMAFWLVMSLGAVAGLFFLAGADFLGAAQLMVYVGGTVVLLAFGVMLTARGPFASMRIGGGQWILAILVGGALLVVLVHTLTSGRPLARPAVAASEMQTVLEPTTTRLGMGLLGVRGAEPAGAEAATGPGGKQSYLLVFEIISVHLLVVLVGAAYLARAKRKRGAETQ